MLYVISRIYVCIYSSFSDQILSFKAALARTLHTAARDT